MAPAFRFLTSILLTVALGQLLTAPALAQRPPDPYDDPLSVPNTGGSFGANGTAGPLVPTAPSGPTRPDAATRPSTWPGGSQDPNRSVPPPRNAGYPVQGASAQATMLPPGVAPPGVAPPGTAPPPVPPRKSPTDPPFDPAGILAHVGTEVVQANEILPSLHQRLELIMKEKATEISALPPDARKEQLDELQRILMKQFLNDMVKLKLLVSDVRSKVPAEGLKKNEELMRKDFNSRMIKKLMEDYKASSVIDLENKLRAYGSSLEAQRTVYVDQGLAVGWLNQQAKDEQEPSHQQMLAFYREHGEEWETPARVRWEEITVKFDGFDSKRSAFRALAQWGNDVLRGVPFAQVAKANSQSVSAEDGGLHDWTSKGSLVSTVLDDALFQLPVGMLSPILEDEEGFHIIRVVEREDLKRTPFTEVQAEIKKKIMDNGKDKQKTDYIAKLREKTPVWTIFDDKPDPLAAQPSDTTPR